MVPRVRGSLCKIKKRTLVTGIPRWRSGCLGFAMASMNSSKLGIPPTSFRRSAAGAADKARVVDTGIGVTERLDRKRGRFLGVSRCPRRYGDSDCYLQRVSVSVVVRPRNQYQKARRKIAAGFFVLAVLPLHEAIEQVKNGSPFYMIAQLREIEEKRLSGKIAAGAMGMCDEICLVMGEVRFLRLAQSRLVQRQFSHQLSERSAVESGQTQQLTDGEAGATVLLPIDHLLRDVQLLGASIFGKARLKA